jgi:hypothetical protein
MAKDVANDLYQFSHHELGEPVSSTTDGRQRFYIPCNDQPYVIARSDGKPITLEALTNRGQVSIVFLALDKNNTSIRGNDHALEPDAVLETLTFPAEAHVVVAMCPAFEGNGLLELKA